MQTLVTPETQRNRDAVASVAGYTYQLYVSIAEWLRLRAGESLLLEVAEDFATFATSALDLTQVKNEPAVKNVSLRSRGATKAIGSLWEYQSSNPTLEVRLTYLTTASPTTERGFSAGRPAIEYWVEAAAGADLSPLRSLLLTLPLPEDALAFLQSANDEDIRNRLLRRITWACRAASLVRTRKEIENRLIEIAVRRNLLAGDGSGALPILVDKVLERIVSGSRILTSVDFENAFEEATSVRVGRHQIRGLIGNHRGKPSSHPELPGWPTSGLVLDPTRDTLPPSLRPRVQLLSRQGELDSLTTLFEQRRQAGTLVLVRGEALSGKSEFLRGFAADLALRPAEKGTLALLHVDLRAAAWPLRAIFLALRSGPQIPMENVDSDDSEGWTSSSREFMTLQLPHALEGRRLVAFFESFQSIAAEPTAVQNMREILETSSFEVAFNVIEARQWTSLSPRLPPVDIHLEPLSIFESIAFLTARGEPLDRADAAIGALAGWADEAFLPGILAAAADGLSVARDADSERLQVAILSTAAEIAWHTVRDISEEGEFAHEELMLALMALAIFDVETITSEVVAAAKLGEIPRERLSSIGWFDTTGQFALKGFGRDALRSAAALVFGRVNRFMDFSPQDLLDAILRLSAQIFADVGVLASPVLDSLVAWLRRHAASERTRWISLEMLLEQEAAGDAVAPMPEKYVETAGPSFLQLARDGDLDAAVTAAVLYSRLRAWSDREESTSRKNFLAAIEAALELVLGKRELSTRQLSAFDAALRLGAERLHASEHVIRIRGETIDALRDEAGRKAASHRRAWTSVWLRVLINQADALVSGGDHDGARGIAQTASEVLHGSSSWLDEQSKLWAQAKLALLHVGLAGNVHEADAYLREAGLAAARMIENAPANVSVLRFYIRIIRQIMRSERTDNDRKLVVDMSRQHLEACLGPEGNWSIAARSIVASLIRDEARRAWSEKYRLTRAIEGLNVLHGGSPTADEEVRRDDRACLVQARLQALVGDHEAAVASCERALVIQTSPAAWHLKLRLLDGWVGHLRFDELQAARPISPALRSAISEVQEWTRNQESDIEGYALVLLWIYQREWQLQGSLERYVTTKLERDGVDFKYLPRDVRVKLLEKEFYLRRNKLEALERRFGPQIPITIAKLQGRGQFVRSAAIVLGSSEMDASDPRDDLKTAFDRWPNNHKLILCSAEYSRYIWDYDRAVAGFRTVARSAPDGELRREAAISLARTLLSMRIDGRDEPGLVADLRASLVTLQDILNTTESIDEVAILRDQIALEVDEYVDWEELNVRYDRIVGRIDGFPTTLIMGVETNSFLEKPSGEDISALLRREAAEPRFLGAAGLLYLRRAQKNASDTTIEYYIKAMAFFRAQALLERSWDLFEHSTTSFYIGWTILSACEQLNTLNPIPELNIDGKRDQISYAEAKFSAAVNRSAGAFRDISRQYQARASRIGQTLREAGVG